MASVRFGSVSQQVDRLFGAGTVSGLSEGQLLERFLARRDEAAFEALVARFGPMVYSVCRGLLEDRHAVEDAFQATFLVLVKKGSTLRDKDLLGNWLYGVAHRVAARARADAARRRAREKGGAAMAETADPAGEGSAFDDLAPVLHEELNRLPEKYRAPLVMCYLEGRSHEETARLLHWPIGTVKGRLARARDQLRGRLSRRGVACSAGLLSACLAREARAAIPSSLFEATVEAAMAVAAGGAIAAGLGSAGAGALADQVVRTMFLSHLKWITAGVVALGLVAGGAGVLAQQSGDNEAGKPQEKSAGRADQDTDKAPAKADSRRRGAEFAKAAASPGPDLGPATPEPNPHTPKMPDDRLAAAQQLYEAIKAYYETGQVTIDRYLDASRKLMEAERDLASDDAGRMGAVAAYAKRLSAVVEQEKARFEVGSSSLPNLTEANVAKLDAEYLLAQARVGKNGPRSERLRDQTKADEGDDDPEDEAQNRLINAALARRIAMPFADPTPLSDVIKYIKEGTQGPKLSNGIPIYIAPQALESLGITVESPVRLELEGVKLRTTLRLALEQLGLAYKVKEGLLIVTTPPDPEEAEELRTREAIQGAVGGRGMMGGRIGGSGGGPGMVTPGGIGRPGGVGQPGAAAPPGAGGQGGGTVIPGGGGAPNVPPAASPKPEGM